LTQEELAERAALSVRAVRNLETGQTSKPYKRSAQRLADGLQLTGPRRDDFLAARSAHQFPARTDGFLERPGLAHGPVRPLGIVPRQLPPAITGFVGRSAVLAELDGLLPGAAATTGTVVIPAITGTAGVGKTALALHWAHRVARCFPDGQLHANLRGFDPAGPPVRPDQAIRRLLAALDVPLEHVPIDLEDQVVMYRSLLADRRMLIMLDNVRDAAQVRPLLPASPGSLVIVTSRNQLTGLAATAGAHLITLDVLTDAEAANMLSARLGAERTGAEPGAVQDLVRLCARLPLALAVAAARVAARPGLPLATLAAELRDIRGRLRALDTGEADGGVGAVLSWSYQNLTQPAARMFRLLGVHPGPDISVAAATSLAGAPVTQTRRSLAELTAAHLIEEHAPGRYTFHDLLRAYAVEQVSAHDSISARFAATLRMLDHYLQAGYAADRVLYPARDPISLSPPSAGIMDEHLADHRQALAWFQDEHRVLLATISEAADEGCHRHAWQILWTLITFADRQGLSPDLAVSLQTALEVTQRCNDVEGQAWVHRFLGRAYVRTGAYPDAHEHLVRALALYQRLNDKIDVAHVHAYLAKLAEMEGRYELALYHSGQALDFFRACGNQAGEARMLNSVGWCHTRLTHYSQALDCCRQALALHVSLGNRNGQAATLDSIGLASHHVGDYAGALTSYQRALELFGDLGNRCEEAETLIRRGDTFLAAERPGAAADSWQRALAILEEVAPRDAEPVRAKLTRLSSCLAADPAGGV
jgi:tetratricopeptide (TPR) repeat protein